MGSHLEPLLDDFLQHLKLERGLADNTIEAYRSDISSFLAPLKIREISSLRPAEVAAFVDRLSQRGARPATLARKLSSLKRFFAYQMSAGKIKSNPAAGYSAPKILRYHPDYLSAEDIQRIIDSVPATDRNAARNRAVVEVLYGCGLRLSELIDLKIRDIEFEAGFVRVTGKGDKQRLVPIGSFARRAVRKYLQERDRRHPTSDSPCLILNRFGKPFSRVGMWQIIRKLVKAAGITRRVTPHTLRHSFATHLIEGGADLRIVQEMLGHADISTTEVYTQIDRDYIIAEHRKYHPRELARADADGNST